MKFEAWPVEPPGFGSGPLSRRIRSRHPSSARWKARLFPTMPEPITTARAEEGRLLVVSGWATGSRAYRACHRRYTGVRCASDQVLRMTATAVSADVAESAGEQRGNPLIRADGVWKVFGPNAEKPRGRPDADLPRGELREKTGCVAAVRDVGLEVWPGEVFVVMGLSGSGKSTLVRTLIRLIEPTAG